MNAEVRVDLRMMRTIASVALMAGMAREEGYDTQAVLAGTDISATDLDSPDVEISGAQELRVIENLVALGVDSSFAFRVGCRYRIGAFGVLGYALINCEDVHGVVDLGTRFHRLSFSLCTVVMARQGDEFHLQFDCQHPSPAVCRFIVERDMAALAMISRDLTGHRLTLLRWSLAHGQQAPLDVYQGVIRTAPEFHARQNAWVFDGQQLGTRLPLANPVSRAHSSRICEELLEQRERLVGYSGRVRAHLMRNAEAMPSMEEVAADFHVTPRTLRRRLDEEGVTFRDLTLEVRRQLAESMLAEGALTMQDIATRLGYRDVSSFITAFRRSTGSTPAAYRRAHRRS